jgi:hypothetical protein
MDSVSTIDDRAQLTIAEGGVRGLTGTGAQRCSYFFVGRADKKKQDEVIDSNAISSNKQEV